MCTFKRDNKNKKTSINDGEGSISEDQSRISSVSVENVSEGKTVYM